MDLQNLFTKIIIKLERRGAAREKREDEKLKTKRDRTRSNPLIISIYLRANRFPNEKRGADVVAAHFHFNFQLNSTI